MQFFINSSCSHVLRNEKVHVYHVLSQKKAAWFYERFIPQTKKALFPSRIKTIVSWKFSGITNTISEQNISHFMDGCVCYSWSLSSQAANVYVTADLYQAKRPYKPKINMLLLVREWFTVLHLEQLFEILVEEMKLDTDVLTLLKKHSLCNLNWSCFEHTVACANVTMLRLYVFENYWEISRGWIFTNIYNRTKIQKWLIGW